MQVKLINSELIIKPYTSTKRYTYRSVMDERQSLASQYVSQRACALRNICCVNTFANFNAPKSCFD